jgi:hypothetical protein
MVIKKSKFAERFKHNLNIEIEEYFFRVKYEAVCSLESDYGYKIVRDKHNRPDLAYDKDKFVPVARRIQGSEEWDYIENYELDIPIREEFNEVDALKEIKDSRIIIYNVEIYEVFAALSLWMLANAIKDNFVLSTGEYSIKAMEALCYAEQLREVEYINNAHALEIAQIHDNSNKEVENLIHVQEKSQQLSAEFLKKQEELSKKHDELSKEIERLQQLVNYQEAEQIRKKQELAIRLNKNRHRENHDAKLMVIAEWLKNTTQFNSAEKAGNYFADWLLNTQKFRREYTPRTVTKWLLEYAKEQGIRFIANAP